jgi:hypothetical protein
MSSDLKFLINSVIVLNLKPEAGRAAASRRRLYKTKVQRPQVNLNLEAR